MQSGYGVSEMQQLFMVDGICSSFFPVAATATATASADLPQQQKQHNNHTVHLPHPSFYHHQQQQLPQYHNFNGYRLQEQHHSATPPVTQQPQQLQVEQQRFQSHFQHPLPFTQQLFQQTHQFHLFHQDQQERLPNQHPATHSLGLDRHEQRPSSPRNSASPQRIDVGSTGGGRIPDFFGPSMNFRLSVTDGNSDNDGGSRDMLDDEDGVNGSERQWPPPPTSREEGDSAIKEPFWRPLDLDLDLDCINGYNKRCKEKNNHHNQQEQQELVDLEIPGAKRFKETINVAAEDDTNYKLFNELEAICNNNQTGSSSALTGENPQITLNDPPLIEDYTADEGVDHRYHTGQMRADTTDDDGSKGVVDKERRRRRRKRRKQHLNCIAAFFRTLVKQLMDHQESLNRKFLEIMEKRENERTAMKEAWRQQQATKSSMEAKSMKEQQAIAAKREATIISFIEKITGETITLPPKAQFHSNLQEEQDDDDDNPNQETSNNTNSPNCAIATSNRWPKAEVQALIRARSQLETRFHEPGLKGPLWEEVSSAMASMGYHRDAKRCKEKWENINKYFRKAKESTKKRPNHSKTCSYFHLLDQLYSRASMATTAAVADTEKTDVEQRGNNSELLDAIVVSSDQQIGYKYSEMIPLNLEFGSNDLNLADEDDRQEGDDDDDEVEGESDLGATKPVVLHRHEQVHEEGMNCIQSSFQELENRRSMKL